MSNPPSIAPPRGMYRYAGSTHTNGSTCWLPWGASQPGMCPNQDPRLIAVEL